ncbi:signal peptidase I [Sporocytophaga myxococcoides]|uniref:signal peptidase I n=1 Tax=Sporocytophaga myxococcoides TaxID=153721 RepID=UPI0006847C09|nr:signal peptidase I [Sporocytophaga myxococcoides]
MKKNKWLGLVLNILVPGLGNCYGRKLRKGLLLYILGLIVAITGRSIAYNFFLFLFSMTLVVCYYFYLILSGYTDVRKDRVYEKTKYDKWYVYVIIFILHIVFIDSIIIGKRDMLPINLMVIPTPQMEPALQVGDRVAVRNTKSINRKDVAVFLFPDDLKTYYIQRCIGLPGENLQIKNSNVFINGGRLEDVSIKLRYYIVTDGSEINAALLDKYDIDKDDYYHVSQNKYIFLLDDKQADGFKQSTFIKEFSLALTPQGEAENRIYPQSENFNWNVDFFGPIYIPKRGDKIWITKETIDLYLKCIEYENGTVERLDDGLIVNGALINSYEFKENYFFMMGDNRHNSLDSRYWGLLPEELLKGKAMYLYWGKTFNRIGKEVN